MHIALVHGRSWTHVSQAVPTLTGPVPMFPRAAGRGEGGVLHETQAPGPGLELVTHAMCGAWVNSGLRGQVMGLRRLYLYHLLF